MVPACVALLANRFDRDASRNYTNELRRPFASFQTVEIGGLGSLRSICLIMLLLTPAYPATSWKLFNINYIYHNVFADSIPIMLEVSMAFALPALASYIFVTTFTPGPNNVSSTSAGVLLGYRKSLRYLVGISAGFLLDMLLTGYFNLAIEALFAGFMMIVKWIGFNIVLALLLGYCAYAIVRH